MRAIDPRETRPPRMGALAVLPVFLDLQGRRAVLTGSGEALAWKAELLAAAGADVEVFTEEASSELETLSAVPPDGTVTITRRQWQRADLDKAAIAVGALAGWEADAFSRAARQHGVPVNIVDNPKVSTFSFGSIVNRSPLVIGISTAGAAPVLAQAVRAKIEALLHPALAAWTAAARRLRANINARFDFGAARREVWRRFADQALAARHAPDEESLSRAALRSPHPGGSVALVGAGPGDPELLTLKALRALQSADIILYDRLVSPEILELARREAKRMLVGKTGNGPSCRQDDINALMLKLAGEGRRVVRLKGGDPTGVRPSRRGDRGLPRCRHPGRDRAGHHGGARSCCRAANTVDRPCRRAPSAARHRPRYQWRGVGSRLARIGRHCDDDGILHERANVRGHAAQAHRRRSRCGNAGARDRRGDNTSQPPYPLCGSPASGGAREPAELGTVPRSDRAHACRYGRHINPRSRG